MKALILALAIVMVSCAAPCPRENAYFPVRTPMGPLPAYVPEGYFDDEENWFTEKELEDLRPEEQQNKQQPPEPESLRPDLSCTGEE